MNTNMMKFALAAILAVATQAHQQPTDTEAHQESVRAVHDLGMLLADEMARVTPRVDFSVDCTRRNYADSVAFCEAQGKSIASIHNQQENLTVIGMIQDKCGVRMDEDDWTNWDAAYIGAEGDEGENNWRWNDGSAWDYFAPVNV
jgi:hypothetical protein